MTKPTFRAGTDVCGLTENMLILTGQKGDQLDKALTLRDAVGMGLLKLRRNTASGKVTPALPDLPDITPEWPNVEFPVAPTDVRANGAFHTITLFWAAPAYTGHSYTEILRAESDNPSLAVAIGTSLANVYSDSVGQEFEAYYWVRFVNKNGQVGPLQGTAGIYAKTSPDVDSIIASADNFAIYNPATPESPEIIFGVTDDGQVAIKEAVIKYATIQILNAEEITADYVVAGVSLTTPAISGGSLDMGNAYLEGGSAGFGLGGPYEAWGKGWNTVIYSDGSVYTNVLRAEGGYVKNMAINNCVIGEDCTINGTLSADHIVGDVVKVIALAQTTDQTITIPAWKQTRKIVVSGIEIFASGGSREVSGGSGTYVNTSASVECKITVNGQVRTVATGASGPYSDNYRSAGMVLTAPANSEITVRVQISGEEETNASWWFDMLGAVIMCFIQGDA
ncbi:phage tail tip fiber protein [Aeromonas enteropelogenes]|uniref:phage tail tip fiber protein n=1 Tax=Aeromonas enteropelogenes TaxID=29489 RepID=UPI003B9E9EF7